jgi:hypothetical protein
LVGHEFDFVKWSLADVGLFTAPLAAPCAGQERAVGNPACYLRRQFQRGQVGEVKRIRRAAVKRTVRTPAVVELQIAPDATARRAHRLVGAQIHFLVLDRFPQPFHEHVVAPAALAVHADGDAIVLEQLREFETGELAALIGIEYLRRAVALDRLLYRLDAEVRRQCVRQAP